MALSPLQLQELQDISIVLAEEFPSNVDDIWDTSIRFQLAGIGPLGVGGLPVFEAAVADLKITQEQLQTVQGRNAGKSSGYNEATLVEAPPGGGGAILPNGSVGDVIYIDTAPSTYLATSVLSLTPAGPNSVILSEVAAAVARTVAPAAGGLEANNLLTGAGFERVLTTADITVGSAPGGVDTNIQYNNAGAFGGDSRFTWDGAIFTVLSPALTGLIQIDWRTEFNPRISMLKGGGAADFVHPSQLNFFSAAGGSTVRIHGGADTLAPSLTLVHNQLRGQIFTSNTGNELELWANNGTMDIEFVLGSGIKIAEKAAANADIATFGQIYVDSGDSGLYYKYNAVAAVRLDGAAVIPDPLILGSINLTSSVSIAAGAPYGDVPINIGANLTGTQGMTRFARQFIQTQPSAFGFNSTLFINTGGAGTSGSDTFIGGTNSANIEVEFGVAVRFQHGLVATVVAETAAPAAGGFLANNLATGAGLERVLTTSDLGGAPVTQIVDGAANIAVIAEGLGLTGIRRVGNTDAEDCGIQFEYQNGTVRASIGNEFFTDLIYRNHIAGRHHIFRVGIGGGNRIRLHLDGDQTIGGCSLYAGSSATPRLQTLNHGVEVGNGTLFLVEQAAQEADIVGQGQLWVNSADDSLNYITEAGVVFDLTNPPAGSLTPWTSDIDADGFDLDDLGVIYMRERSAAEADVLTQGQIWVLDEGFTQSLMYTNDNGNDFELAALNLTDMNTSSLSIPSTSFVECLVCQPDINRNYMLTAVFEIVSPATDDMDIELVIDTNAVFKGVLHYAGGGGNGEFAMDSQVGEVITNIVTIPTDGTASPNGTYVTITGCLRMGATSGTHSVRAAKNVDVGANGSFVATAALQLLVLQVS